MSNRQKVRAALKVGNNTSRSVANETGLTITMCAAFLNHLAAAGEIVKTDEWEKGKGRPMRIFRKVAQ